MSNCFPFDTKTTDSRRPLLASEQQFGLLVYISYTELPTTLIWPTVRCPCLSVMQVTGWDKAKITTIILPAACCTMKRFPTFHLKHNIRALVTYGCRNMSSGPQGSGTILMHTRSVTIKILHLGRREIERKASLFCFIHQQIFNYRFTVCRTSKEPLAFMGIPCKLFREFWWKWNNLHKVIFVCIFQYLQYAVLCIRSLVSHSNDKAETRKQNAGEEI
jgi:hypothetical protein